MSDSKVYMFPESGASTNSLISTLVPFLSQRGVDPNVLLAMNNRNNDGFGEGGWFIWILFLFLFGGWGNGFGNGFGGNGFGGSVLGTGYLSNQLNNDLGRDLLMQAIQGNGSAINQLATTLNCSVGDIQTAINGVMAQVQNVGNQVGMSSMQVINAIQAGNCQIGSQLAQCCCDLKSAIKDVSIGQERGFASVAYETQRQTCSIEKAIKDSTDAIVAGQRSAEMREMQDKIDSLREAKSVLQNQISQEHQTAAFGQMIGQATAPIVAAVNGLQNDVNGIKCKLPETVTIPATPEYIPVNRSINVAYAPYCANGFNTFGNWGWNNGYCNNSLWG